MTRFSRLLVGAWFVAILLYVGYAATSTRTPVKRGEVLHYEGGQMLRAKQLGRDTVVDLFAPSGPSALIFVSRTCSVCVSHSERLLELLASIPASHHRVVDITPEPVATSLKPLLVPAELLFTQVDSADLRALEVRYVPLFVLVHSRGLEVLWVGMPGVLQVWWARMYVWWITRRGWAS